MNEIWETVPGYRGKYEVSNLGRVRSYGVIISQRVGSYGYYRVNLYIGKLKKTVPVHRLVAKAFIPNPNNLPQVNHIDEDKKNNRVDNLEWCDNYYNTHYGGAIKRAAEGRSKPVVQMDIDGTYIATHQSMLSAARALGIDPANVSACCTKRQRYTHGYKFDYAI
jgi:hypothetical protein